MHVTFIDESKLTLDVSVYVLSCLCVAQQWNGDLHLGFCLMAAGIGSSKTSVTLNSRIEGKWMDDE